MTFSLVQPSTLKMEALYYSETVIVFNRNLLDHNTNVPRHENMYLPSLTSTMDAVLECRRNGASLAHPAVCTTLYETFLPAPFQEVLMDSLSDVPSAPGLLAVRCKISPMFMCSNLQMQAIDIRSSETSVYTRLNGVTSQKPLILA
jgi:hypothetical protein